MGVIAKKGDLYACVDLHANYRLVRDVDYNDVMRPDDVEVVNAQVPEPVGGQEAVCYLCGQPLCRFIKGENGG